MDAEKRWLSIDGPEFIEKIGIRKGRLLNSGTLSTGSSLRVQAFSTSHTFLYHLSLVILVLQLLLQKFDGRPGIPIL
jgi:hypothetical protein